MEGPRGPFGAGEPNCIADSRRRMKLACIFGGSAMGHKTRIMYIERKAGELTGPARIGRVTYSKTGATLYYQGHEFRSLKGAGFKANYYDVATGDEYWISGPRKDGNDALYATNVATEIDQDVANEYWAQIRNRQKIPRD